MTSCNGNAIRRGIRAVLALALALPVAALAPAHWRDASSGLVVGGFDPISYFSHGVPKRGLWVYETVWSGGTWRFLNSGNRDEFIKNPTVYAPRFAGHDPKAIAEGALVEGHPRIWAIHKKRLYFFYSPVNRSEWVKDPTRYMAKAEKAWKTLSLDLPRAE